MRKLFTNHVILLTLIASLLFASSCEKSVEVVEADLIGTWDIGQASVDIRVGPVKLVDFLIRSYDFGQDAAEALVEQLTADFLEIVGGAVTFNADYSYMMVQADLEEIGTWKLEGNKLYLTITGETMDDDPLSIESMNSSSAIVAWEEDQEVDLGEGPMSKFTATIIIELNLSKQ